MTEEIPVTIEVTVRGTFEYRDENGDVIGEANFVSTPLNLNQPEEG